MRMPHEPGWLAAEPIELPFGFHPLEVEYRRTTESARIGLFWEGPQFGFEPVASRWLLHDREQKPCRRISNTANNSSAGCAVRAVTNCPASPNTWRCRRSARSQATFHATWLINWLAAPKDTDASGQRRMPHFALAPEQAAAMAATLLNASEPLRPAKLVAKPPGDSENHKKKDKKKKGDEEALPPPQRRTRRHAISQHRLSGVPSRRRAGHRRAVRRRRFVASCGQAAG